MLTCANCGFEQNSIDAKRCMQCGFQLASLGYQSGEHALDVNESELDMDATDPNLSLEELQQGYASLNEAHAVEDIVYTDSVPAEQQEMALRTWVADDDFDLEAALNSANQVSGTIEAEEIVEEAPSEPAYYHDEAAVEDDEVVEETYEAFEVEEEIAEEVLSESAYYHDKTVAEDEVAIEETYEAFEVEEEVEEAPSEPAYHHDEAVAEDDAVIEETYEAFEVEEEVEEAPSEPAYYHDEAAVEDEVVIEEIYKAFEPEEIIEEIASEPIYYHSDAVVDAVAGVALSETLEAEEIIEESTPQSTYYHNEVENVASGHESVEELPEDYRAMHIPDPANTPSNEVRHTVSNLPDSAIPCPYCGQALPHDTHFQTRSCVQCDTLLLPDARYCHRCGTEQPIIAPTLHLILLSEDGVEGDEIAVDDAEKVWSIGRTIEPLNHFVEIDMTPYGAKERGVSRSHAEIRFDRDLAQWLLSDLGSQFGTFVNDEQLSPQEAIFLADGQKLRFGGIELRVTLA